MLSRFLLYRWTCAVVLVVASNASSAEPARQPIFERDVFPILRAHCTKCHGLEAHKAGLDVRTKQLLIQGGENGAALLDSNPEESLLFTKIASREMPPDGELDLTAEQIDTVRRWIEVGAPVRSAARPLTRREAPPLDDDDQGFWAFRKIERPVIPTVDSTVPPQQTATLRTPIDAFVLRRLRAKGLTLAPRADRRTLIRRIYFDLLGLPPSPRAVEEFVGAPTFDAYERLVDRLLASPHFGERWARYWLDAAGFAEVRGTDFDAALNIEGDFASNLWRYREYVINSLNEDKPFDRFLTEQLAGDELVEWRGDGALTPEAQRALVATNFLRTAHDLTWDPPDNTATTRFGVLHRTIASVTSNVLGLTVGCAQCHSHKFDPISQLDYYRFMALFTPAFNPQSWLIPGDRDIKRGSFATHAVYDVGPPPTTYLLRRGEYTRPGPQVQPGFPRVLCDTEEEAVPLISAPRGETSGRRLALARWLTRPEGRAGALVARVQVNRAWEQLFGFGLARSSENLGRQGELPTHPELLEWLAADFINNGWRLKPLLRQVLQSAVYLQSARSTDENAASRVDPGNRLLWKKPLRRLSSEAIRDAVLATSGKLDLTVGGPSVMTQALPDGRVLVAKKDQPSPTSQWRRSVYLVSRRNYHPTLLSVFDQPRMGANCLRRERSAVVLQSLTMLNDEFTLRQSEFFAGRVIAEAASSADARVARAFELALARPPDAQEQKDSKDVLARQTERFRISGLAVDDAEAKALAALCLVLINTSEFIYVE